MSEAPVTVRFAVVRRRCRVCELRAMSDVVDGLDEAKVEIVASPAGLLHLTEGSGYTFCGKDCHPWEKGNRR